MRREDCCQDLDSRQGLFELTHSAGQSPVRPGYPGDSDEPASLEGNALQRCSSEQAHFCVFPRLFYLQIIRFLGASLVAQLVTNLPAMLETWFDPWVGKIPWRRERLPTPVFWPGEFHGLCSPWGREESDTTETSTFSEVSDYKPCG